VDVDLRKVRYFVAVAERLHFGRAAEALHIAQSVLSRQIRALENELKTQVFVRDKRTTELTRPDASCAPTPNHCWPTPTPCSAGWAVPRVVWTRSLSGSCPG
jgi:hypothetical protein